MEMYPVMLKLSGKICVVVGGGKVAERKIAALLDTGAHIRCISPHMSEKITEWVRDERIAGIHREYEGQDAEGAFLLIAATNQAGINKKVYEAASERHILVNVVDHPELSTFIVPSALKRGDLTIAVSTSGASPALARHIRKELKSLYGSEFAEFVELLRDFRTEIKAAFADESIRRTLLQEMLQPSLLERIRQGEGDAIMLELNRKKEMYLAEEEKECGPSL